MKVKLSVIGSIALFILLTVQSAFAASPLLTGKVLRVYDGDTIQIENLGKVRMIGIDSPESEASDRDGYYVRKGVSPATLRRIATTARKFVIQHAKGQQVTLTTDREERDRHGRLLAYLYLPDGRLLNRMLLEAGLATVYRRFDFSLKPDFLKAEQLAKRESRGIWTDLMKKE